MKNILSFLILLSLLLGCTPGQPPAAATSAPATTTEQAATLTPTAVPTATSAWPPRLTIPDAEVPTECRTRDEHLSTPEITNELEYWGYGDLGCRLFLYSPDGRFLVYVQAIYVPIMDTPDNPLHGLYETVKVMRVPSGEIQFNYTYKGKGFVVNLAWLSSTALNFQIGSASGIINNLIYDVATDSVSSVIPTPTPAPVSLSQTQDGMYLGRLAWSPDSKQLVSSSYNETGQVRLLNATDLAQIWQIEVEYPIVKLYFSPDGKNIAALSMRDVTRLDEDGKPIEAKESLIQWFNARDGALIAKAEVEGTIIGLEYNPNGQNLAALVRTAKANHIWLFNARNDALLRKWDVKDGLAHVLHFSPWANQIATAGYDLVMWDAASGNELWRRNADGQEYSQTGQAKLVNLKLSPRFGGGGCVDGYGSMLFSLEKPLLIVSTVRINYQASICDRLSIWDLETRQIKYSVETSAPEDVISYETIKSQFDESIQNRLDSILDVAMSYDEQTSTVTLLKQYALYVWDTRSDAAAILPHNLDLDRDFVFWTQAAIHPQGELMALWAITGGEYIDHFFDLYNSSTGKSVDKNFAIYGNENATMLDVAFSPDGHWLAAANKSGSLMLWNLDQYRR